MGISDLPSICFLVGHRANVGTPLEPTKEGKQETPTITFKRIHEAIYHEGLAGPAKLTDKFVTLMDGDLN